MTQIVPLWHISDLKWLLLCKKQLLDELKEFEYIKEGVEIYLCTAINKQAQYSFKNKNEIIFDSWTGLIFPNFEYVSHINYSDWSKQQPAYSPSGLAKGKWKILNDWLGFWYPPQKFRGEEEVTIIYQNKDNKLHGATHWSKNSDLSNSSWDSANTPSSAKVLPHFNILNRYNDVHPDQSKLTWQERKKIILDFFISVADWGVIFDDQKAQAAYDYYHNMFEKKEQLFKMEFTVKSRKEETEFTSDFSYHQKIDDYNIDTINSSILQYSISSLRWFNDLLNELDDWENSHQDLIKNALELNTTLARKPLASINLNMAEQQLLDDRHIKLQQLLDFGLEPVRSSLIDFLKQAKELEKQIKSAKSLQDLAHLEQQARPSFTLLAEHSATLCTQTLKKLEWLENSLDFVQAIVKSEQQTTEDYLIFLDKYQQDLLQIGLDNSIETAETEKWFNEWRQERLQMLKQWQPLIQAGLDGVISEEMVLDTLQSLSRYQQNLDQFYLQKRLGIHTTYAFQPNGHRQEKLEKEQELTKLNHQFMQQLEQVIFAASNTAQKIWLVRYSEVWQQDLVEEITQFLTNEQLIDRSDIAQIISEEMRKVEQQNLAACLQDAQSYSQALAQREKDLNTLVYKMRKALMK